MKHTVILPALIAASVAFGASVASAGTVFDFVPRMDFVERPELVSKDRAADALKIAQETKEPVKK